MTAKQFFIDGINKWLRDNDKKQKDISDMTGIDPAQISKYLNKDKKDMPNIETLVKIATALDLSIDYLLSGKTYEKKETVEELSASNICTFLSRLYINSVMEIKKISLAVENNHSSDSYDAYALTLTDAETLYAFRHDEETFFWCDKRQEGIDAFLAFLYELNAIRGKIPEDDFNQVIRSYINDKKAKEQPLEET